MSLCAVPELLKKSRFDFKHILLAKTYAPNQPKIFKFNSQPFDRRQKANSSQLAELFKIITKTFYFILFPFREALQESHKENSRQV